MAKVLCVLYDDPLYGYPPIYPETTCPRLRHTLVVKPPVTKSDRLQARTIAW